MVGWTNRVDPSQRGAARGGARRRRTPRRDRVASRWPGPLARPSFPCLPPHAWVGARMRARVRIAGLGRGVDSSLRFARQLLCPTPKCVDKRARAPQPKSPRSPCHVQLDSRSLLCPRVATHTSYWPGSTEQARLSPSRTYITACDDWPTFRFLGGLQAPFLLLATALTCPCRSGRVTDD